MERRVFKFLPIIVLAIAIPLSILAAISVQDTRTRAQQSNPNDVCAGIADPQIKQDCLSNAGNSVNPGNINSGADNPNSYKGCSVSTNPTIGGITVPNPLCIKTGQGAAGESGLTTVVMFLLRLLFAAAGIVAFGMLIWGGVSYILSNGDPKAVASARGKIIYAIVGLVITALSLIVFTILGNIFGFNLFSVSPTNQSAAESQQNQMLASCRAQQEAGQFNPNGPVKDIASCMENECRNAYPITGTDDQKRTAQINRQNCINVSKGIIESDIDQAVRREAEEIRAICKVQPTDSQKHQCAIDKCYAAHAGQSERVNAQNCLSLVGL